MTGVQTCALPICPFSGKIYSQEGIVQKDSHSQLTPEEIVKMDWLADNVIGAIPRTSELREQAQAVTLQQGVKKEKGQI